MKLGDLVKRVVSLGEHATTEELERFDRIGILIDKFHEPFSMLSGTHSIWSVLWQDGKITGGHWSDDLELINESR